MGQEQWIGIAVAVVVHNDHFLVGVRDATTSLPGKAEFPGGKIEPGESPEVAAVRECLEETGVVVEPTHARHVHRECYEHGAVQLHFIQCRVTARPPVSPLPDVASPWRWVLRSALPSLDFPRGNRHLIQELVREVPPATRGPHG